MDGYDDYTRECPVVKFPEPGKAIPVVKFLPGRAEKAVFYLDEIDESKDAEFRSARDQSRLADVVREEHNQGVTLGQKFMPLNIPEVGPPIDNGALMDVCNYYPRIEFCIVPLNRNGEPDSSLERTFLVKLMDPYTGATLHDGIPLQMNDFKRAATIFGDNCAGAILYPNVKGANKLVENEVRRQVSGLPTVYKFTRAGWNRFKGRHFYAYQGCRLGGVTVETNFTLPFYSANGKDLAEIVWKVLALYKDKDIARVLFLYSLSGVMYALFREAGYPIHFLLFILGKSGSFKTALAKVLYTQLSKEEYRDQPRQIGIDTTVSFERAIVRDGCDTVMPFDDFNPARTASGERILKDNLESIIRMTGDGTTRSRSNKELDNLRGEGVQGTIVVTGELMGTGLSSNLRCLYCNIERNFVDTDILTELQKNKYTICTLIKYFTDYLSQRWEPTVEYIRTYFGEYRNDSVALSSITNKRLIDTYATLKIISDICSDFFMRHCGIGQDEQNILFGGMKESLLSVIRASESATEDADPATEFMKAFLGLIETGKFMFKEGRLYEHELNQMDGFYDEKFVYVLETNFYEKTEGWLNKVRMSPQMNLREIQKLLYKDGYLVAAPNGASKVTYCCRIKVGKMENKVNFMKFRKSKLQKLQQGQDLKA